MSCIPITACQLASLPYAFPAHFQNSKASICPSIYLGTKFPKVSFKLTTTPRYQRAPVVCLFGGKGKSENGNEGSPWKAIENVVGNFRNNQSIEDVLKKQIEKGEYFDDGGTGGEPPRGGGGGGDGFGEGEDEGLSGMWDEFVQVICATMGFIFLYIFIIESEEITVIGKDLIKFLLTRQKSIRLSRFLEQCTSFLERMKQKEEFEDPYWLEREIISTPTWYDSPAKYNYIFKALESRSHRHHDDDDGIDNDNEPSCFLLWGDIERELFTVSNFCLEISILLSSIG